MNNYPDCTFLTNNPGNSYSSKYGWLQYVNFHCTAKWFGYAHTCFLFHILFHYNLSQGIVYSSLCYTVTVQKFVSWPPSPFHPSFKPHFEFPASNSKFPLSILHMVVHMFPCYFLQLSHPLLPPIHVHKSVLYVCISTAALKIGSSVSSF